MSETQLLADVSRFVDQQGRLRSADVEAHRIAALVEGGMTTPDILRDYPRLDREQVKAAVAYARAHPASGHGYPRRTVKSAVRDTAGGGLGAAFEAARDPKES